MPMSQRSQLAPEMSMILMVEYPSTLLFYSRWSIGQPTDHVFFHVVAGRPWRSFRPANVAPTLWKLQAQVIIAFSSYLCLVQDRGWKERIIDGIEEQRWSSDIPNELH